MIKQIENETYKWPNCCRVIVVVYVVVVVCCLQFSNRAKFLIKLTECAPVMSTVMSLLWCLNVN